MTTPRGEASEPADPAEIRETGIGWPGAPAPPRDRPAWDSPRSAHPRPASKPSSGSGSTASGGERDSRPVATGAPRPAPAGPGVSRRPAPGATGPSGRSGPSGPAGPRVDSESEFDRAVQNYRSRQARTPRSYELPPERPGTVTAAAVILWVSAGLGFLACCGVNYLAGQSSLSDSEQTFLTVFSVIVAAVSVFNVVLGYFVWEGRQWARVTTIVFCAIGIAGQILNLLASGGAAAGTGFGVCVGIALNGLVIGLLSGSEASGYFQYHRR